MRLHLPLAPAHPTYDDSVECKKWPARTPKQRKHPIPLSVDICYHPDGQVGPRTKSKKVQHELRRSHAQVYSSCNMKALSLAIALIGIAAAAQAKDLRSDINSMSKVIGNAMQHKDFKTLEKTMKAGMTKDFTYVENGQNETYDQMLQNMKMGIGQMKRLTYAGSNIVSLKEKGSSATCKMKHTMSGVTGGADKKEHKLTFSGVSEDSYVKVAGKWKMSKMVWKSQTMTMDGKPMPTGH